MENPGSGKAPGKTCICANGELRISEQARAIASQADLLIAADGGARYLEEMGLTPDVIVGDMDSLYPDQLDDDPGISRILFPVDKNRSDTELAVEWALENGARHILLLGAWGGRPDHALGNAALLLRFPGRVALWEDGFTLRGLAGGQREDFKIPGGSVVSLIPFDRDTRVKTEGLEYPLDDENLNFATHGLSNRACGSVSSVTVTSGLLILCVEGRDPWPGP